MRYAYICEESKERFERNIPMSEHTKTVECTCGATAKQDVKTYCSTDNKKRIFYDD